MVHWGLRRTHWISIWSVKIGDSTVKKKPSLYSFEGQKLICAADSRQDCFPIKLNYKY